MRRSNELPTGDSQISQIFHEPAKSPDTLSISYISHPQTHTHIRTHTTFSPSLCCVVVKVSPLVRLEKIRTIETVPYRTVRTYLHTYIHTYYAARDPDITLLYCSHRAKTSTAAFASFVARHDIELHRWWFTFMCILVVLVLALDLIA